MIKDNRDGGGSVGAFVGCLFFLEIVGARRQLTFQGLFLALIFWGGFSFLGNEIGGVRRHCSGFLWFPRQKSDETHSGFQGRSRMRTSSHSLLD